MSYWRNFRINRKAFTFVCVLYLQFEEPLKNCESCGVLSLCLDLSIFVELFEIYLVT